MKKIMMAAAIVCAVCSANAASLSWTAYQYYAGETGNPDQIADLGYFLNDKGEPYAANPVDVCLCLMDGDSVKQVLDVGVNDGYGGVSGYYEFAYSEKVISNNDILKVMFRDDKGNFSDLVAAANADGNDPTVFNTLKVAGLSDDTWTNDEFVFATGNYTMQSVPEPTSGLLLLLGVAGLALRRKQK